MNRRRFLATAAALPLADAVKAQAPALRSAVARRATSSNQPIMARFRLTLDRVLHGLAPAYTPEFLLQDVDGYGARRFTNFSGDVSGRWIGAMSAASATYRVNVPALDEVVRRTIALQHSEGFFGRAFHFDAPTDDDMALLWGNGRLLVGLMEYHALTRDAVAMAAAEKLGGFLLRIAPAFNSRAMAEAFGAAHFASSYICWTQQTEGLAALYAATKDTRYRDLCAAISERMERRPADHVHGFLCSVRGTLDLYNATGDKTLLDRVEAAHRDVMRSGDLLLTGGVPESWSPNKKRTEGCAECDWLRLNLALWRTTADPAYLETAERILFNDFAMNQFATGDFGHAVLNERGTPGVVAVRAWWCCTLHGLRAFPDIHRGVFRTAGDTHFYDLPVDGSLNTPTLAATASSRLAKDGTITLRIARAASGQSLTLRQPPWSRNVSIRHNGNIVAGATLSGLKSGDLIRVHYAMSLRQDAVGDTAPPAQRKAFFFGPWLLGASSFANPKYFGELHPENLLMVGTARGAASPEDSPFRVPIAASTLSYTAADFPVQPAQMELRAIAEQTAIPPAEWEMAFLTQA